VIFRGFLGDFNGISRGFPGDFKGISKGILKGFF